MKTLLIRYDNASYTHWFPLGLGYIASYLRASGHSVEIYDQALYHLPESHLEKFIRERDFDLIGLGIIAGYYQYSKLLKISKAIKDSGTKAVYVLGGHGPSPDPGFFLRKTGADFVVIGEGEETISELSDEIMSYSDPRSGDYSKIRGIAYLDPNGDTVITPQRELLKDVDSIRYPSWDLFNIEYYAMCRKPGLTATDRMLPMLTGRGCPYRCNFCYRMVKGFRARSNESIFSEIDILKKRYYVSSIDFSDELLMSSAKRTEAFCEGLLQKDMGIKWSCNGRLNYATKDVLELMKKSGCVFINYGIESMDNEALRLMNKKLDVDTITRGVEATRSVGIAQGLNIIFGNIGENREVLKKDVAFIKKNCVGEQLRTIRPVTPYPGSDLFDIAVKSGKIKDVEDFYENKHINSDLLTVNFTDMSDEEVYDLLGRANIEIIEDYFEKHCSKEVSRAQSLYRDHDASFRGFRRN